MIYIRPWLYLGKHQEALNTSKLAEHNIEAILLLHAPLEQSHLSTLFIPIEEGVSSSEIFKQGIDFVIAERKKNHNIFLACETGGNRSIAFGTAILKEIEGMALWDAFQEIKQIYPIARPHADLWKLLCVYYQEEIPYTEVLNFSQY